MSRRLEEIDEFVKQEVSKAIAKINEPSFGLVTVLEVTTQKDLKKSIVRISIMSEDPRKSFKELNKKLYEIKSMVSQKITFKYTPKLELRLDESGEYVSRINDILEGVDK